MLRYGLSRGTDRRRRVRRRRTQVGLAFVGGLAALAGMTDAIGFLAAGDFVSFMSGNTTQLAIAVGQGRIAHALFLALIVLVYVAGNALGIVSLAFFGGRQLLLLLSITALLASAAGLPGADDLAAATLIAVFAMGLVNAAVERVDGHPFGITYVTGALSRFGRGLGRHLLGDRSTRWGVEIVPFFGMLTGAVMGAIAHGLQGRTALLMPAGMALLLALASLAIPRRWRRQYQAPVASNVSVRPLDRGRRDHAKA